ncbi:unnamed protein product [Ascophyllum nodosum]
MALSGHGSSPEDTLTLKALQTVWQRLSKTAGSHPTVLVAHSMAGFVPAIPAILSRRWTSASRLFPPEPSLLATEHLALLRSSEIIESPVWIRSKRTGNGGACRRW